MKKKWINIKLYADALKQLKIIGIMSFVILSLASILTPVGISVSNRYYDDAGNLIHIPVISTLSQINGALVLAFVVVIPLMCLYLFSFLNKRHSSDFYHSIPYTRTCLYLTYGSAILTWISGIILLTSLFSIITVAFLPEFTIIYSSILPFIITVFVCCLLVAGAILVAMSVTGSIFTNLAVSGLLLFLPRLFLAVANIMLVESLPFVPGEAYGFLLSYHYNLIISWLVSLVSSRTFSDMISWSSILYTGILGIIYLIAGGFLFKIRKSESAGQAASSRILQLIFRLSVAFPFCLLPAYYFFIRIIGFSNEPFSGNIVFQICIMYLLAVIAYLLYELITTRKWKNLLKSVPGLGILALLNLVFIFGMTLAYHSVKNDLPDASEIDSVRLLNSSDFYYDTENSYFFDRTEDIALKDEEVLNLVADRLRQTALQCDNGNSAYYRSQVQKVAIKTGIRTIYRYISLEEKDFTLLSDYVTSNKQYQDIYSTLPDLEKNNTVLNPSASLSSDSLSELYQVYQKEVQELEFSQWYQMLNTSIYDAPFTFSGQTSIGTKVYSFLLPVNQNTPETLQLFMKESNLINQAKKDTLFTVMNTDISEKSFIHVLAPENSSVNYCDAKINLSLLMPDETDIHNGCSLSFSHIYTGDDSSEAAYEDPLIISQPVQEKLSELAEILSTKDSTSINTGSPVLMIQLNYYCSAYTYGDGDETVYTDNSDNISFYYELDNDCLTIIKELYELHYGEKWPD